MKKIFCLLALITLCSGCAINLPLTGNLDGTTTANLQAGGLKKVSLGYYVDPETRSKELERYTDGKYAGGRAVIIPIGQALSNALYQGLKNSYDEEKETEREVPPPSQAGIMEKVLNRIALQFTQKIKGLVPAP